MSCKAMGGGLSGPLLITGLIAAGVVGFPFYMAYKGFGFLKKKLEKKEDKITPTNPKSKYWIHSAHDEFDWKSNKPSENGKWFFQVSPKLVDRAWDLISKENKAGRLGIEAKTSTANPENELLIKNGTYCIFVYNQDAGDKNQVYDLLENIFLVLRPLADELENEDVNFYYKPNIYTLQTDVFPEEYLYKEKFKKMI